MAEKTPEETALSLIIDANKNNSRKLSLRNIELEKLSSDIGQLVNLIELDLTNNQLSMLPKEIEQLVNLEILDLSGNNFKELPREVFQLSSLKVLKIKENKLSSLPSEINLLTELVELDITYNQLSTLPVEIGDLKNLSVLSMGMSFGYDVDLKSPLITVSGFLGFLDADRKKGDTKRYEKDQERIIEARQRYERILQQKNKFQKLPLAISKLTNLKKLEIDRIGLTEIFPEILNLSQLEYLDASKNNISSLPRELIELKSLKTLLLSDNPLLIPPEILNKTNEPESILNYYYSIENAKRFRIDEIKLLIVGQGSVGKTSLVQRILHNAFDKNLAKTEGVAISETHIQESMKWVPAPKIKINIWDFGGQEIMHATHQFFLTKRSLYLLVLDSRLTQEENRVEYWLKIIQSFGGESPVLIVGNKIDQHPLDIDRTGLQKKYPNIVGILETSAATGTGIEMLKFEIAKQVDELPHVRDLLPETWFTVKTKLERLGKQSNFITHDKYLELCAENEVSDETSQRTLIGFLHDLGVVLHFQDDPRLEALGILNPQWVTNGVYKILNSHTLFQNKGVLTVSMLNEILHTEDGYPRDKRLFIVDMMKKFELCYDIDGDTFLVPDLLPKDEPYTGEWSGALAFKYAYGVLPSSIMSRFIVKMKDFVHQPSTWRSGTILKKDGNTAFIKADFEDKTVTIKVQGSPNTRRDTLSLIRGAFEMIHKSVARLDVTQQVPHPQYPNLILDYEELIEFEREGVEDFPRKVDGKVIKVNVREMLNGVESESQRREKNVVINNYYNARDGGIIVGRDFSGNLISGNYNKINSAEIAPELKDTLLQLGEAVNTMIEKLPAEQAAEVAEDFGKLADEAVKPKPNKKWYSVSIEGLIKAAENLDKLGTPVISLSRRVLSLLTGG